MGGLSAIALALLAIICLDLEEVMSVAIRSTPSCNSKAVSVDVTSDTGVRVEKGHGSSIEFEQLSRPVRTEDYVTLDFKTDRESGLLLYLASRDFRNYILVFLQNGKPRLRMKCGEFQSDIKGHLSSSLKDGKFHRLVLNRTQRKETVLIDNKHSFRNYYYTCPDLDLVYLGGIPSAVTGAGLFKDTRRFHGCLKNFRLNGAPVNEYAKYTSVSTC